MDPTIRDIEDTCVKLYKQNEELSIELQEVNDKNDRLNSEMELLEGRICDLECNQEKINERFIEMENKLLDL